MQSLSLIFVTGLFLFIGTLISKPSKRYGVPSLILYLGLGFIFGNGYKFDFLFDFPNYVNFYSQFAIGIIVFVGGLSTSTDQIKLAWKEGVLLSSFGVILTTLIVGYFTHLVFRIDLLMAMLLGAVLSATDAAAVFSILETKNLKFKEHISETLEFESSTNDPVSFFLVVALTLLITTQKSPSIALLGDLFINMGLGALVGLIFGYLCSVILHKISFEIKGFYSVNILSVCLLIIGLCQMIPANSLLALYLAGVVISHKAQAIKEITSNYFEATSWLMQISLFVVLGLQANPAKIFSFTSKAFWVTLCLVFVARPIAVFLSLIGSRSTFQKKLLISWVGLRGATPIAFALIPLTAMGAQAEMFFNISFLVVCISVMLQGTTIEILARKLKLLD
ncbi:MAG: potassium/proton antiporter [Halobacteriovoraceae bacterium]|nr:potassium/proton antiporter [Halobacteriovoraceae bacterium]|tara:strand:+ start:3278 stop:4456 length:1179 start_codon:yes stop_codon:yes gene_type:complete